MQSVSVAVSVRDSLDSVTIAIVAAVTTTVLPVADIVTTVVVEVEATTIGIGTVATLVDVVVATATGLEVVIRIVDGTSLGAVADITEIVKTTDAVDVRQVVGHLVVVVATSSKVAGKARAVVAIHSSRVAGRAMASNSSSGVVSLVGTVVSGRVVSKTGHSRATSNSLVPGDSSSGPVMDSSSRGRIKVVATRDRIPAGTKRPPPQRGHRMVNSSRVGATAAAVAASIRNKRKHRRSCCLEICWTEHTYDDGLEVVM
jgi:hypothetical protein